MIDSSSGPELAMCSNFDSKGRYCRDHACGMLNLPYIGILTGQQCGAELLFFPPWIKTNDSDQAATASNNDDVIW